METIDILKKLKNIKPDSDYSKKSRAVILSQREHHLPVFSFSFRQIANGVLRSGWSMALTAIFLLLAIGSFSVLKILSPATTAVVDLTGLKAEAQAIDAQIELTSVVYNSSADIENKTSTVSIILRETKSPKAATKQAENGAKSSVAAPAENSAAQPTIDSALDMLSR